MRRLFLYGGVTKIFEQLSRPFVDAAGGANARIALLCPSGDPGWDRYLPYYLEPWHRLGAAQVLPVCPVAGTTELDDDALHTLRTCTAVFMCGGDTRRYHAVYVQGPAGAILRDRYRDGMPYAGMSAGALVTPDTASIWGDRLTTPTNRLALRGSEDGCDAELQMAPGLGYLPGTVIEAHFSEQGGFPRLVAAMEQAGAPRGLGLDDSICVEIADETLARVHGQGRTYRLTRVGSGWLKVAMFDPGQEFTLE